MGLQNWLIGKGFDFARKKLQGVKSYIVGVFCVLVGIALMLGKLMVDGMEDMSWDTAIAPWFAFGIFVITNAAKGNKTITKTGELSDLVNNLTQTLGEHKEKLDTVQKHVEVIAASTTPPLTSDSPQPTVPVSPTSGSPTPPWNGNISESFKPQS